MLHQWTNTSHLEQARTVESTGMFSAEMQPRIPVSRGREQRLCSSYSPPPLRSTGITTLWPKFSSAVFMRTASRLPDTCPFWMALMSWKKQHGEHPVNLSARQRAEADGAAPAVLPPPPHERCANITGCPAPWAPAQLPGKPWLSWSVCPRASGKCQCRYKTDSSTYKAELLHSFKDPPQSSVDISGKCK